MAYLNNHVDGFYIPNPPPKSISEDEETVNVVDQQFTNHAVDFDPTLFSTYTPNFTSHSIENSISECHEQINTTLKDLTTPDTADNLTSVEVNDLLQKYSSPKEEFFGIFEPRLKAVDVDKLMSSYGNPSNLPTPKENYPKYPKIPSKKESTVIYEKLCAYINQHVLTSTYGRELKHSYHSLKNKPNVVNSLNYAKQVRYRNNIPPKPNTLNCNNADPTRIESRHMYGKLGANIDQRDVGGKEHENRNSYNSSKNRPVDAKSFNHAKQVGHLTTSGNNTPSQSNMFNHNNRLPTRKESQHMYVKLDPYSNQHNVGEEKRTNTNSFNYPKKIGHRNNTPSQSNMFNYNNRNPCRNASKDMYEKFGACINELNLKQNSRETTNSFHYPKKLEKYNNTSPKFNMSNYNNTNPSRKESKDMYEKFGDCINELNLKQNSRDTTNSFHYPKKVEKYINTPPKFNMSNYNNTNPSRKESKDMYEKFGACINELNLKQNARERDTTNSFHYPKKVENYNNTPPKFNMSNHRNVKPNKKESKDTYRNERNYKGNACSSKNLHNSFNHEYEMKHPFNICKQQEELTNDPSRFDAFNCTNANPMKKESIDKYQVLNAFTNQHNNEEKIHLTTPSNISLRNKRFIKNSFKYLKEFEEQNRSLFKSNTLNYTERDMKNEDSAKIYDQLWTHINERIVGGKEPHISMKYNSKNDCHARNLYNYLKKIEQPRYQAVSPEMLDYCRRFVVSNIYDRFFIKYNLMKIFARHSLRNQL